MTEQPSKNFLLVSAALAPVVLVLFAYLRPGYFTGQLYIGGILLLEFLIFALWKYRKIFFVVIILAFLFAGTGVPGGGLWTAGRWFFLAVGAWVGILLMFKEREHHFGLFHAIAGVAGLAALISAAVSRYQGIALLKALSVLLLFAYAATGARLAVSGRENRFFPALIAGCELFVVAVAGMYAAGYEFMGNPNSLGAVMAVVGVPILLWGTMVAETKSVYIRRLTLVAICMYLVFHSHARAAMVAAFIVSVLLCLGLRKYKMLAVGLATLATFVAAEAIFQPQVFSQRLTSATSTVMFKGKDPQLGIFQSRQNPWQAAVDTIQGHFWFGTGFGTTDQGEDASERLSQFSTNSSVNTERGSSYLAILTWVGIVGVLPFAILVVLLASRAIRTVVWMFRTGIGAHPAIPLALIIVAGFVHAGFEDWLFAAGYYLCVFFWSMAFVLIDIAPSTIMLPTFAGWRFARPPQPFGVAPGR